MEKNNELPQGWIETNLENICLINSGQSPPSSTYNSIKDGLPFFQGNADFGELYPETRVWCSSPKKIAEKNDLLLSVRAPVGEINISKEKCCIGRGLAAIRSLNENMDIKFLIHFFRFVKNDLDSIGTGTTFKAISRKQIRDLKIKLPPLNEQKRIVEKIEKLFMPLENISQTIKTVKKSLLVLNESILTSYIPKIFLDFLNKSLFDVSNFEKEKKQFLDKLPSNWRWGDISEISDVVTDGAHLTPPRLTTGELMLSARNVRNGFLDLSNISYVSKENFKKELKHCAPQKDDILMVCVGATIGRTAIVRNEPTFMIVRSVALIRPSKKIIPFYLLYYMQYLPIQNVIKKMVHDTARGGLYLNKINKIPIVYPASLDEQKNIIKIIELFKSREDNTHKIIINLEEQISSIKNSILKQAFEGKLVPQDPNDEPASELLKRIKNQ